MQKLIAIAVLTVFASHVVTIAAPQVPTRASIAGVAQSAAGQAMANIAVQLRDLATGRVEGTTNSSSTGTFGFAAVAAGLYSVELINAVGEVVATSAAISVASGAAVTGVMLMASTITPGSAPGGRRRSVITAAIVTIAAAAVGIAAVVPVAPVASPSR